MQRFYIDLKNIWKEKITIADNDIVHQVSKVLRLWKWDKIIILNSLDNFDYVYELIKVEKRSLELSFVQKIEKNGEIDFELNLYQALPNKLDKLEQIVQKTTEVWYTNMVFFRSDRSQKLILSDKKIARLKKIINEAVEQSGRNKIPNLKIEEKIDIKSIVWENIYFHTKDEKSIDIKKLKIKNKKTINLFVWPEGWWSDEELKSFEENVYFRVYLWERIFRCETVAPIVGFWIINN